MAIVAMDASIKNDIATSISHMYILNHPLIKTLHHIAFVTSAEAELFAITCGINQASSKEYFQNHSLYQLYPYSQEDF